MMMSFRSSARLVMFCLFVVVLLLTLRLSTMVIVLSKLPLLKMFHISCPFLVLIVMRGILVNVLNVPFAVSLVIVPLPARSLACAGAVVSPATWLGRAGRLGVGDLCPGKELLSSTVPSAEDDDDDADYVPPPDEVGSVPSDGEVEMASGDEEVAAQAATPPHPRSKVPASASVSTAPVQVSGSASTSVSSVPVSCSVSVAASKSSVVHTVSSVRALRSSECFRLRSSVQASCFCVSASCISCSRATSPFF